jgi:hypothetical protein
MSKKPIRPSTLDGIKRYAKTLKTSLQVTHAAALDAAAVAAGFQNFMHARRQLGEKPRTTPSHVAYITTYWRVRETGQSGQETLPVPLATPLDQLVQPAHLRSARHFSGFRFAGTDHLTRNLNSGSQSDARRLVCAAARTLAFMEATGLRPSAGHSRTYPSGSVQNAVPGKDHYSEWYDPTTRSHVFVDEPYTGREQGIPDDRLRWAHKHSWEIVRTSWAGMYYPEGDCALYLAADKRNGHRLKPIVAALDSLPPPIVEMSWNGESGAVVPPFFSPAARAKAQAPRPMPRPQGKRSPRATVPYRMALQRTERRRPAKRMPIEAHVEVGERLKSVIAECRDRRGVCNRLKRVRCDLDDWVQCEYNRAELPDDEFFGLYYREDSGASGNRRGGQAQADSHIVDLQRAKSLLIQHYPDCAPLRAIIKNIDAAIQALPNRAA